MNILSIDTASDLCTVAILKDTTCIKEITINDARNHSEKIMPVIEQVLQESNIILRDINLIVCDKGPGSFTGIRIGIGTVLAFQDTLKIPCIGISALESLAYNTSNEGLICSLIDAKNNNVYFGLFELKNNEYTQISNFEFKTIEEALSLLQNYASQSITFVGDGTISHKDYIINNLKNCKFCTNNQQSSYSLGLAGYNTYQKGIKSSLTPLYLRKSQAERTLEEKNKQ